MRYQNIVSYFCIMSWTNSLSIVLSVTGRWYYISNLKQLTVDSAIAVLVSLSDHLINLIISELLADGGHDMSKLSSRNETVVVTVEHLESLADLLLRVGILHLARHHGEELFTQWLVLTVL